MLVNAGKTDATKRRPTSTSSASTPRANRTAPVSRTDATPLDRSPMSFC
jgi:hypothetical protein